MEVELERTFLLKTVPANLRDCDSIGIIDAYIPSSVAHPVLRLRKKGNVFEMTKKYPVVKDDSSEQKEETISLSEEEFLSLLKIDSKKSRKTRYYYPVDNKTAEIDIFLDDLEGLALVDFEFSSNQEKSDFIMPDFCLADVTQEESVAGGFLAGKKYSDIEPFLKKYGYKRIINL